VQEHEFLFSGEDLRSSPLLESPDFDIARFAEGLVDTFRPHDLGGVIGTGDYPGAMVAAIFAEALGLVGPPAKDVVLLSHKFYSRELQARATPEAAPEFAAIDPLGSHEPPPGFTFPFFVKPVQGTMSMRAQMVHDREQLRRALHFTDAEQKSAFLPLRAYEQLVRQYATGQVPPHFFIAEKPLFGEQVTVDGFVQNGRVTIMGVVDSVMYPGTISFQRFQYPSVLPDTVQSRMADVATRLIEASGLDHTCFNIEMFHDPARDSVSIIEVNPRMSYQFADFYERVDGMNTYEAQIALATGRPVSFPRRQGTAGAAASFVMRRFSNAFVDGVPTEEEIVLVREKYPGTMVNPLCSAGTRLSDYDQDVQSFRYCLLNMSAPDAEQLHTRYKEVRRMLTFNLRDADEKSVAEV
jgi:hypothetical protein